MAETVILGVDPGTLVTGYGIVRCDESLPLVLDYGCIKPPPNQKLTDRYLIIHNSIELLIQKYEPKVLVVETQYVRKNVQSALKLGMARGVVMIVAKRYGLAVFEYSPAEAKKAVCNGRASKKQVQIMVQHLFRLPRLPEPEDAADALALTVCHEHRMRRGKALQKEI